MGAPKALTFVGLVEEDGPDFGPRALEDRAPFFMGACEAASSRPFAVEVVESDAEPLGVFVDAFHDEAAGVEDPGVDVRVADAAFLGLDAHLFERRDAFGAERWSHVPVGHRLGSLDNDGRLRCFHWTTRNP